MLKMFIQPYGVRNFSNSRLLRNTEKEKDVVKSTETPEQVRPPGVSLDFVPNEFEKTILVLSGKYKSKSEIPPRINFQAMENARSRVRIRGSNILMVGCLMLCGYYIWRGKERVKKGESLNKIYMDMDRKIIEDAKKKQNES